MTTAVEQLVEQFRAQRLPKTEWSHEAHLKVGLWHLLHYPEAEALILLRDGIKCYNLAVGVGNTDDAGYHETITRFYVWRIARFLLTADRALPIDVLAAQLIEEHGDKLLPFRYWSREQLMSPTARREWLPPDLLPLE